MFCILFALKSFTKKTSFNARANLFFRSSDIYKENPAFLDHWTCDLAFKLTGIVVLLVRVTGRQSFVMS